MQDEALEKVIFRLTKTRRNPLCRLTSSGGISCFPETRGRSSGPVAEALPIYGLITEFMGHRNLTEADIASLAAVTRVRKILRNNRCREQFPTISTLRQSQPSTRTEGFRSTETGLIACDCRKAGALHQALS